MKTVLLFLFIMSADMHSLRSVIELPRIPAYYPKTKNTDKNMAEEYILECLLPYFYNRYKRIIVQKIN